MTPNHTSDRLEIHDLLDDTGVWISGGVIVVLVLWLVITELWHGSDGNRGDARMPAATWRASSRTILDGLRIPGESIAQRADWTFSRARRQHSSRRPDTAQPSRGAGGNSTEAE